jgi:hypothetical protein
MRRTRCGEERDSRKSSQHVVATKGEPRAREAMTAKSNSSRWSKFDPLYKVIDDGVKIFSSPKHNLLQQFPYSPSQLAGLTMPRHLLLPLSKSSIFGS